MDWLYALDLVMFGLCLISVPLYVLLLYTLIKYRKTDALGGSFFTLSLSLGVCDILHLLVHWCISKFGQWAWFGVHKLVMTHPAFFAKFTALLWSYTTYGQKVGVLLAAVNRLTVISSGVHAGSKLKNPSVKIEDWTPGWVKVSLVMNWAVPLLFTAPYLMFGFNYARIAATGGVFYYWENPVWGYRIFFGCSLLCGALAGASGACYMVLYYKTRASRQQSQSRSRKAEINLVLVGFVLFILTGLCGVYCFILTTSTNQTLLSFMVPFESILFDVYSWINPYLLLVCSTNVRKYVKAVVLCRKVNVVTPTSRAISQSHRTRQQHR